MNFHDYFKTLFFSKKNHQAYVSGLTHDMRGPLTSIRLNLELACKQSHEMIVINRIRKGLTQVKRIEMMINDLLDVNRLEAGAKIRLNISRFDLEELFRIVVDSMKSLYGERIAFIGSGPIVGNWCQKSLERLLENLLTNAMKYGDKETPVVVNLKHNHTDASFDITNQGHPLDLLETKTLFMPYVRHSRKFGKTSWGLGLATVKEIVLAHHGLIQVKSDLRAGTHFTVTLPKTYFNLAPI